MKRVRIILSPEAEEVYRYLNANAPDSKKERAILAAINQKKELIKANTHYGEPIEKKLIPKEYRETYGVSNLFWVNLPSAWRMLYTLTDGESEIEIIAFILDVFDHKEYDKKFGYRKK